MCDGHASDTTLIELRGQIAVMRGAEDGLMMGRVHEMEGARARNSLAFAISALLTVALGVLAGFGARKEREALREAETDELTGLANRRVFFEHAESSRRRGAPFAVLFADVNGLKRINDTLGHDQGDRVIAAAAHVLRATLRQGDVLARLGGDEFAAVLPKVTPQTTASVKRRLREAIDAFNAAHPELPFRLSISLGLGCFDPRAPRALVDILGSADHTMYESKRSRVASATLSVIRPIGRA